MRCPESREENSLTLGQFHSHQVKQEKTDYRKLNKTRKLHRNAFLPGCPLLTIA